MGRERDSLTREGVMNEHVSLSSDLDSQTIDERGAIQMATNVELANSKKAELDSKLTTLKTKLPTLEMFSDEWNAASKEYTSILADLEKAAAAIVAAVKADNAVAIDSAKAALVTALETIVANTNLATLLGEPVLSVVYVAGKAASSPDANDAVAASVTLNPKRVIKAAGGAPKAAGTTTDTGRAKRAKYHSPDGTETLGALEIVDRFGTDEEKAAKSRHSYAGKIAKRVGWIIKRGDEVVPYPED